MKKALVLMFVGMFVLSLGFASADTVITGNIYNSDYTELVGGANVTVTCNGNINTTTSNSVGSYNSVFNNTECNYSDSVSIYAIHPDYGFNTVNINVSMNLAPVDLSIGVGNVPLVPEFGFVIGMLTILGAVGIFFVVRKD